MQRTKSKSKKINLGFIGAGFIAQECHIPSFDKVSNCKLNSIADLHYDLAKKIGSKYSFNNIYEKHSDLLKNNDIDAVIVTLPRNLTAGVVEECLLAGKHVLTEKPLAFNYETGKRLKDLSEKNKLILHVGYMKKYDNGSIKLKKIIEKIEKNGKKPVLVNASCFMGDSYCNPMSSSKPKSLKKLSISPNEQMPNWIHKDLLKGYENYLNVFTHLIDFMDYLFDKPLSLIYPKINLDGHGITLFESNGIPIEISTMKCDTGDWIEMIDIIYDDQIVSIEFPPALLKNVPARISIKSGSKDLVEKNIKPEWSWAFFNQAKFFINLCKSPVDNFNNISSAVNSIKIVEEIFKHDSITLGKKNS